MTDTDVTRRAAALSRSLLSAGRTLDLPELFHRFCREAAADGLPLERVSLHLRTLNPQFLAYSLIWSSAEDRVTKLHRSLESMSEPGFLTGPLPAIFFGGPAIAEDLRQPSEALRYPISRELQEQGFTAYLALPLPFASKHQQVFTAATRAPEGFGARDLAVLDACLPALTAALEVRLLSEMARTLLATYVGERAGDRVWEGSIHRGGGEEIYAVVYTCDLRAFTALAAGLDLRLTTRVLNAFFDAMGEPILARGGEILKLIGDAILAVFPCTAAPVTHCLQAEAALTAAREGLANLARLDHRALGLEAPLTAGTALTVGELLYGNIGVANRLDFTVIGPAVNMAARLQGLGAQLGEPILMSDAFARRLAAPLRSLGRHALKGVPGTAEVFAPP